MIGRCDQGGLAALTREVHRHLRPSKTLLLDLANAGRGPCDPDDYEHGQVFPFDWRGSLTQAAVEWLCDGVEQVWTAETFYTADPDGATSLLHHAHRCGVETHVYTMPELAPWTSPYTKPRPRKMTTPTAYMHHLLAEATILPCPVARDRLPFVQRDEVRHVFHPTGHAMRDRNGTRIFLDALANVITPLHVTIRYSQTWLKQQQWTTVPHVGHHDVEWVEDGGSDYWRSIPVDADLLVLPRRYAGLSLPLQEAASRGVPALVLASDPYADAPFTHTLTPTRSEEVRMKGGLVPVWTADPRALAAAVERLVREPEQNAKASAAADSWAEEHAWSGPLGDRWRTELRA